MALIGKFSETPFTDLIQFYASSRQTVAVTVSLPDGRGEDGVFYVEGGDVVDAWLGDAVGRDAIRRALCLADGAFRVESNIHAAERTISEPWRQVMFEETIQIDEERRKGLRAARAPTPEAQRPLAGAPAAALPVNGSTRPQGAGTAAAKRPAAARAGSSSPAAARGRPGASAGSLPKAAAGGGARKKPGELIAIAAVAIVLAGAVAFGIRSRKGLPATPAAATAASAMAPGAPAGGSAAVLTFGMVSPLFGPDKEVGRGMKAGVEIAFAAANEAGGVHGRRLALVALDDGNEPSRTVEGMRDLLQNRKVFAVVGNAGTATAAAALPAILDGKVPFVGALGGAALRKDPPDRYVFVYRPSLAEETAAAVRYLVDVRRVAPHEVAVFAQDDDFGEAGWAGVAQQLKAYGHDPAGTLRTTYRRNSADVIEAARLLRDAGGKVKAVVMIATHLPAARLVLKLVESGPGMIFTDVSSVDAGQLAEDLLVSKAQVANRVVVTQVVPSPSSRATAVMRYRALLEKNAQGEVPGALSLEGWVVGTLVVEALKVSGPDPDPERMVLALESLHELDIGIGVKVGFSHTDHQASHKVWGTALDSTGTWRQVDLE